ncbi:MAG: hypothetical protein ABUL77_03315 [Bacteroidota bacterium]
MRATRVAGAWLTVAALTLAFTSSLSCGRSKPSGAATADGGTDAGIVTDSLPSPDHGPLGDGGVGRGCLDQPTDPPRPPGAELPCELFPPLEIIN